MKDEAFKTLRSKTKITPTNFKYPDIVPATHNLDLHLKIFFLISEYNNLMEDMDKISSASQNLIKPRLKEIEDELFKMWVIESKDVHYIASTGTFYVEKGKENANENIQ